MPWMLPAAVVGGSLLGANAAGEASDAQSKSSAAAVGEQRRQFDISRADSAPYRDVGSAAASRIGDLLGLGNSAVKKDPRYQTIRNQIHSAYDQSHQQQYGMPLDASFDTPNLERVNREIDDKALAQFQQQYPGEGQGGGELNKQFTVNDFYNDPVTKLGFDFGLSEGTKSINRSLGASGMLKSGAAAKGLTRFATDYGGTKAAESSARFYGDQDRIYNRLAGVSGTGQVATANQGQVGANTATNIGNIMTGEGNARGAAAIARGNAFSGGLNTIGSYYGQNQMLDKILNRGLPSYGSSAYTPMYGQL